RRAARRNAAQACIFHVIVRRRLLLVPAWTLSWSISPSGGWIAAFGVYFEVEVGGAERRYVTPSWGVCGGVLWGPGHQVPSIHPHPFLPPSRWPCPACLLAWRNRRLARRGRVQPRLEGAQLPRSKLRPPFCRWMRPPPALLGQSICAGSMSLRLHTERPCPG